MRPYPHLKKEISFNPGQFGPSDIACKITDEGAAFVSADAPAAAAELSNWFKAKTGRLPGGAANNAESELGLLMRIWGDATHIAFVP